MPILYESTDRLFRGSPKKMQEGGHSWSTGSFLVGLGVGALIFTSVGRELVKTAAGITEEEIRKRLEARKKK